MCRLMRAWTQSMEEHRLSDLAQPLALGIVLHTCVLYREAGNQRSLQACGERTPNLDASTNSALMGQDPLQRLPHSTHARTCAEAVMNIPIELQYLCASVAGGEFSPTRTKPKKEKKATRPLSRAGQRTCTALRINMSA